MFDSLSIIINKNSTIIEGNYYRRQYWELVEDGELIIWKGQSNMFFWGKEDLIVLSCSLFTNAAMRRTFSSTQNVLQQYTAASSHFLIIGKIDINIIP